MGMSVNCPRFDYEGAVPLPIRWPPAANLVAREVRSYGTPFAASVGRHFSRNESEETWREYLYSFQAFERPAFRQTAQQCVNGRRFAMISELREETAAWHQYTNDKQRGVDWQLRIDDARIKLKSLYPKIKA
jgi:hypothetical protein